MSSKFVRHELDRAANWATNTAPASSMTNPGDSRLRDTGTDGTGRRPAISIIMPFYNSERFIAAAIDSILEQDFENFEILAINDNSTDASLKIVREYVSKDRRVRCLTNQRTKGVSGARNTGLDEARGEWITFLDSDDLMVEDCLSIRLEFLAQRPDCRMLATDHSHIDETGKIIDDHRFASVGLLELAHERAIPFHGGLCLERPVEFFFDHEVPIWTGSVTLHASVIEQTGGFDETMSHSEDTKYWYRAALHNKVFILDIASVCYRQHDTSLTKDTEKRLEGAEVLYRDFRDASEFSAYRGKATQKLAKVLNDRSYHYRENGMFLSAALHAAKSVLAMPSNGTAWRNLSASFLRVS